MSIVQTEDKRNIEWRYSESNVGSKLLSKMGWKEGSGIGLRNKNVTALRAVKRMDGLGIGAKRQSEGGPSEVTGSFASVLAALHSHHPPPTSGGGGNGDNDDVDDHDDDPKKKKKKEKKRKKAEKKKAEKKAKKKKKCEINVVTTKSSLIRLCPKKKRGEIWYEKSSRISLDFWQYRYCGNSHHGTHRMATTPAITSSYGYD
mmetsp:Transcript_20515/g.22905  ORF Transcript_20515/g.22905 Transcript_20515/m.22905 type:complete len:202 (+) Transcript_20515:29-634(+)